MCLMLKAALSTSLYFLPQTPSPGDLSACLPLMTLIKLLLLNYSNTITAFSFAQHYLLPHSTFCFSSLDTMLTLGMFHVSKNHYFTLKFGAPSAFPVSLAGTIRLYILRLKT